MKGKTTFVPDEYRERLKTLREIICGDSQVKFAKMLGMPWKRWNTYERGYPIPRETAWLLHDKFDISIEWIWYGYTGNVSDAFVRKIEEAKRRQKERAAALARLEKTEAAALEARAELRAMKDRRKVRQAER